MNFFCTRLALVILSLFLVSTQVCAGTLDDYYLQQFGEQVNSTALQKAVLLPTSVTPGMAHCGTPLKHGLQRDWKKLEAATQKVLAKQMASPTLSGESTYLSPSGKFKIHYTTSGTDAVPSTNWVHTVAQTFDDVASSYAALGWRPAPTVSSGPYDVYLRELSTQGLYGQTSNLYDSNDHIIFLASQGFQYSAPSYMEIDNNFTDSIYSPYSAIKSLEVTAAHEYHHAIQYGYNYYFNIWYAEATSTWMEDELYNDVNQSYNYIDAWFENSTYSLDYWPVYASPTTTGAGYGRWIFNRYLSEKHDTTLIRSVWEGIAGLSSPDGYSDIPMIPVLESVISSTYAGSLGDDFFGFSKRVYTRDWTTHTSEIDLIPVFSPVAEYSVSTFNSSSSNVTPSVTLPGYSFAYYSIKPSSSMASLTVNVYRPSGIKSAMFKNGSEITAAANGTSYTVSGLGTSDELILLLANTTSQNAQQANFSTNGSLVLLSGSGTPEAPQIPLVYGSSNHCFIATAAYGSYLHPQVRLLRNFRDEYLLTNAPGRSFVALYYHYSPPLADIIARHPVLRGLTRLALTPLVITVAHPLGSASALFLLAAGLLLSYRRRIKNIHFNAGKSISCPAKS
jgi:hypothetical protein